MLKQRGDCVPRFFDSSLSTWGISIRDIVDFPILKDAHPWFWPTVYKETYLTLASGDKVFTQADVILFSGLARNEAFIAAKYYCLLKAILIPERCFESSFEKHLFFAEDQGLKDSLILHFRARRMVLQNLLLLIPDFRKYLIESNVEKIIAELQLEKPDIARTEVLERLSSIKDMVWNRSNVIDKIANKWL